ncbi:MAG: type IV pilus secretin PilQ [Desulfamplus sp.]
MSHLLFTGFRTAFRSACFALCLFFLAGCITATQLGKNSSDKSKRLPNQIQLNSIDLSVNADTIDVNINGNGKMKYSAVKQDFPLGVMVYLHNASIADKFKQPVVPKDIEITSIFVNYADDSKSDIEIKILLNKNLNYQVQEKSSLLTLLFYKKDNAAFAERDIFQESEKNSAVTASSTASYPAAGMSSAPQQPVNYSKRAVVTGIDFHSGDEGESSIVINTSNPIRYDMKRNEGNNELSLNLYNTDIPEHQQRQLITTYFNSAVDRIVPIDRSGSESASKIKIIMREKVPYHILQEQNSLTLFMEPSSVKPMKLEDAVDTPQITHGSQNLAAHNTQSSQISLESVNAPVQAESDDSEPEDLEAEENKADQQDAAQENQAEDQDNQDEENVEDDFFDDNPVYTGEEISLDFYETDIKNVFRILQTVSGENFAVDKDVQGTVTLTLEKPAPWDEILALILKMNGLGKIKEGSITRIATMQTIKREQDEKAAIFLARAQAKEQKKQQEPMFTEYIPINYANADADIKPHIEKLLTPERNITGVSSSKDTGGKISVDKRTNMIILTDTKKVIEQAKHLIYTLDKVTPQILISARIVEVTKDFSRELGVNWNMSSQDVYRDDLGGLYGFDIAVNNPVNASSGIGYTFNRLAGTPLLLDARLTAAELTGDTKIISAPKILTLDNKTAKIDQGLEYGYQSGVDENGNPVIEFKPIKLSLEVTPQVTPDNRVAMTVKISKNEVSGTVAGIPSLSTSEANTELLVNDGNTIVIGGIVKSTVSESKSGIPVLSNIPYLGQIFRTDTSTDKKNELLIFITPTIVQLEQKNNGL